SEGQGGARLISLYDFENKKVFFPDIDSRFKFCALVFGGEARRTARTGCAFYLRAVSEIDDADKVLALAAEDFAAVNPNTGAAPIFRTRRDAEITTAIYRRQPVLVDRRSEPPKKLWPARYVRMFDMTNDAGLFLRRDELEAQGWYPVGLNRWKKGETEAVPLYEGKMVQMYDHRAADVVVNVANLHRPAQQEALTVADHQDAGRLPQPQFWVNKKDVAEVYAGDWVLGFKEITAPTNVRTMIACIAPGCGFGNKFPLLLPEAGRREFGQFAPLLLANVNTFVFDFVLRQKLHGQTINLYILEQLPLIRPEQFEQQIGKSKIADFVRGEVLRLSYTAHDLA
ncbi:MAG: Eco57I restriction-modification methylase domain-containing protein, partial [Gammaproteobacteria bacterium]